MDGRYNPVFKLFPKYQLNRETVENLGPIDYMEPIKLAEFVVNNGDVKVDIDNIDNFYLKYALENLNQEQPIFLKPQDDEKIEKEKILKSSENLDVLLKQILKNKQNYLYKKTSDEKKSNESEQDQNPKDKSTVKDESSNQAELANSDELQNESQDESNKGPRDDSKVDSKDGSNLASELNKLNFDSKEDQSDQFCPGKLLFADFVGLRAVFNCLLTCQYNYHTTFIIYAEIFAGTIYLVLEKDDLSQNKAVVLSAYATKKFKELCSSSFEKRSTGGDAVSDETNGEEKDELTNFERAAYHDLCFIYRTKIDRHRILFSSAIDCFEDRSNLFENPMPSSKINTVLLKTCKKSMTKKQEQNFKAYKSLKFWSHSVLINNNKLILALFNDDYRIDEIREYKINDLVKAGNWSSRICFHQLDKLLSFIQKSFSEKKVDLLKFHHESSTGAVVCMESDKQILPQWYKAELSQSED